VVVAQLMGSALSEDEDASWSAVAAADPRLGPGLLVEGIEEVRARASRSFDAIEGRRWVFVAVTAGLAGGVPVERL
jgi:hypothetical protein